VVFGVLGAFFEGDAGKVGVFVVKLWWMRGKSWLVDGRFCESKNMPGF
jgi:hypothetical protein